MLVLIINPAPVIHAAWSRMDRCDNSCNRVSSEFLAEHNTRKCRNTSTAHMLSRFESLMAVAIAAQVHCNSSETGQNRCVYQVT
jgi:hypothetical protein